MTKLTIPLVGAGFRPPAKQVLTVLPLGFELSLKAEPDNEYDPNAVAVFADMGNYPISRVELLDAVLSGTSFATSDVCSNGDMMLGYLAASGKKTAKGGLGNAEALMLASTLEWGLMELKCTLSADMDGAPTVVIESEKQ